MDGCIKGFNADHAHVNRRTAFAAMASMLNIDKPWVPAAYRHWTNIYKHERLDKAAIDELWALYRSGKNIKEYKLTDEQRSWNTTTQFHPIIQDILLGVRPNYSKGKVAKPVRSALPIGISRGSWKRCALLSKTCISDILGIPSEHNGFADLKEKINEIFRLDPYDKVISEYCVDKGETGYNYDHIWPVAANGATVSGVLIISNLHNYHISLSTNYYMWD
jgi:hypothetical protein